MVGNLPSLSVEAMPTGPSVGWTLGSRQEESYTLREQTTADGLLGTSSMRSFLPIGRGAGAGQHLACCVEGCGSQKMKCGFFLNHSMVHKVCSCSSRACVKSASPEAPSLLQQVSFTCSFVGEIEASDHPSSHNRNLKQYLQHRTVFGKEVLISDSHSGLNPVPGQNTESSLPLITGNRS